jgi:hypothetical protein
MTYGCIIRTAALFSGGELFYLFLSSELHDRLLSTLTAILVG